ncbi:hypothetical protein ATK30_6666 [Amycolatopsis echigonensis]|uniref:Uncharacterized protein n=1 Tax=Amycolatopsis echigonensis TaxID=2576905 RepID=A0A2N3WPE4_9PSEU|nr:hypothetical protein [Amycolatopsis niigatensis]PKV95738.1 hypothetical protein ATK30_6666 [Amycolatopsis niigatensis]
MDEHNIENHPDLMDPDWRRHAEKEAWTGLRRQRRRARRRRWLTISAAVVIVVAAAGFYLWKQGTRPEEIAGNTPSVPAATTTAPAPTDLPDSAPVDLTRPFEKTPAQNWPEGIAGLTIPAPAKVGSFSAKQVGDAQEQVKHAVEVAQFDKDVLEGHHPDGYIGLFAPDQRADLQAHVRHYAIYLAEGYHLLPVQPRMTGKMTVRPGETGELMVHVSYVVAYAFDPGSRVVEGPADLDPFVRVDTDYIVRSGSGWAPGDRGLWTGAGGSFFTSVACRTAESEDLAPAFSDPNYDAPSVSREPGEFDPDKPLPTKGNCKE